VRSLVTGVAGFIGSHLAERLLAEGETVVGVDCFTTFYDPQRKRKNLENLVSHPQFQLLEIDLSKDPLDSLPEMDFVFHLAAQAGVRSSWGKEFDHYTRYNVLATQRILEHSRARGVDGFLYASSSSVYGDAERFPTREDANPRPFSPYGVTKLAGEHLSLLYHRNFDVPTIALRFFTVYGPRQRPDMGFYRFIEAHLDQQAVGIYGDGTQSRDFTFVGDCVHGILSARERGVPGGVYNLGSGSPVSVLDVMKTLGEVSGREPKMEFLAKVAGDVYQTAADNQRARQELDFEPQTSLTQGLAEQLAWQQELREITKGNR